MRPGSDRGMLKARPRRSHFVLRTMGSHGGLKQRCDMTIGIWKAHSGVCGGGSGLGKMEGTEFGGRKPVRKEVPERWCGWDRAGGWIRVRIGPSK